MNQNQKGFGHFEILITVAVLGIVGLGALRVISSSSDPAASSDNNSSIETLLTDEDLSSIKTFDEIASLSGSSDNLVGYELESEDGVLVYVLHFSDGTTMTYNAQSGEEVVHSDDNDDELDDSSVIDSGMTAKVTIKEAINIARAQRSGSEVEKVEMGYEDGKLVYKVKFTDDSKVLVNAVDGVVLLVKDATGEDVINIKQDYDDDDDDDSSDDREDNSLESEDEGEDRDDRGDDSSDDEDENDDDSSDDEEDEDEEEDDEEDDEDDDEDDDSRN